MRGSRNFHERGSNENGNFWSQTRGGPTSQKSQNYLFYVKFSNSKGGGGGGGSGPPVPPLWIRACDVIMDIQHHTCDISRYRRIPSISRALICPLPDGPRICPVSRYDKKSIYVLYFTLFFIQVSISLCKV